MSTKPPPDLSSELVGHRDAAVLPGNLGIGRPEVLRVAGLPVRDRKRCGAGRVRLPGDQEHDCRSLRVGRAVRDRLSRASEGRVIRVEAGRFDAAVGRIVSLALE